MGFLDFGNLAAALQLWPQGPSSAAAPLQWVGYDSSAYAVGKAMVVAEMMQAGAPTDAVLQVGHRAWAWVAG